MARVRVVVETQDIATVFFNGKPVVHVRIYEENSVPYLVLEAVDGAVAGREVEVDEP